MSNNEFLPNEAITNESKTQVEELLASPELARAVEHDEFKRFLDHLPVAIVVSRTHGGEQRIVYWNVQVTSILQLPSNAEAVDWAPFRDWRDESNPDRDLASAILSGEDYLGTFRRDGGDARTNVVEAYAAAIETEHGAGGYRITALVDISGRDRAQRELLHQQIREKDLLLRELQHRVRNNLQLVVALIRLESRRAEKGDQFDLENLAHRVEALAILYRALSPGAAGGEVDLGQYLSEIATAVMRAHSIDGIRLEINVEHCPVSVNVAMPTGLIVNEAIINAFKHAFQGRQEGTIAVRCLRSGANYFVCVEDDGVGLPVGMRWPAVGKISDLMAQSLQENIGSEIKVESAPGQGMKVSFLVPAVEVH